MEILKKHYEKFLLGVLLVGFCLAFYYLSQQVIGSAKDVTIKDLTIIPPNSTYQGADFSSREFAPDQLLGGKSQWQTRNPVASEDLVFAGDLVVPFKAARCSDCKKIIPLDTMKQIRLCPICKATLEVPPEDVSDSGDFGGVDSDGDGMPDTYELKMGFNPNDPRDASLDADGDGFSNLYEYLMGTDPLNPKSFPGLDKRIYLVQLRKITFPVELRKLTPIGENKSEWNLQIYDLKLKNQKFWKVGQTVTVDNKEYLVSDAVFKESGVQDSSVVVSQDESTVTLTPVDGGESITLQTGKRANYPDMKAVIEDISLGKIFQVGPGDVFRVGDDNAGYANFQVVSIDMDKEHVVLLNQENGNEFLLSGDVPPSARVSRQGSMGPGVMMPGMPAMPGAAPLPGASQTPRR